MSTLEEIDHAVAVLGKNDLVILHCTSTYPSKPEELNLSAIPVLKKRYGVPVGYSGHEVGLQTTEAAVALVLAAWNGILRWTGPCGEAIKRLPSSLRE